MVTANPATIHVKTVDMNDETEVPSSTPESLNCGWAPPKILGGCSMDQRCTLSRHRNATLTKIHTSPSGDAPLFPAVVVGVVVLRLVQTDVVEVAASVCDGAFSSSQMAMIRISVDVRFPS